MLQINPDKAADTGAPTAFAASGLCAAPTGLPAPPYALVRPYSNVTVVEAPLAVTVPFTVAVDFEGDQWTFFKPSLEELRELYGIDVQELTVWRPLIEHAVEHLRAGKLISCETNAFWLPDTAGTDYRTKHSKTTILLANLDVEARQLGYFHNAGYFELSDEDFTQLFRLEAGPDPAFLPLFAELVHLDRLVRRPQAELAACSLANSTSI